MKKRILSLLFSALVLSGVFSIGAHAAALAPAVPYSREITAPQSSQVVVVYKQGSVANLNKLSRVSGQKLSAAKQVSDIVDLVAVKGNIDVDNFVKELRSQPGVEAASKNKTYTVSALPNDPYTNKPKTSTSSQWWLSAVGADKSWAYAPVGSAVVAVLDTGVNANHPDLKGRITKGYDYVRGSSSMEDVYGHGTAVAGTIVATANNKIGISGVVGKANIKVAPYRVGGYHQYDNQLQTVYIVAALKEIARNRKDIKVINMSYGGYYNKFGVVEEDPKDAEFNALKSCMKAGKVLVASAGNEGDDANLYGWYSYPASYNGVISVAATDKNNKWANFSQYNDRVDIAAPGTDIVTTSRAGGYIKSNGTSFSSPIVAGAAALIIAQQPSLSPDAVEKILKSNAKDVAYKGNDQLTGAGLLQVNTSVPISIRTQPVSISTYSGKAAKLTVAAKGIGLRYQWYKNGVAIKGATSSTYSISRVATANAGNYYCRVYNTSNAVSTRIVSIGVKLINAKSIAISGSTKVPFGKYATLKAEVSPTNATSKSVIWKSSNTGVATVSSTGVVKGVGYGKCIIFASSRYTPGVFAYMEVQVVRPVSKIALSKAISTLRVGKTSTISAVAVPANASYKSFAYSSSSKAVATVSPTGVITAKAKGTVVITVAARDGSGVKTKITIKVI